MKKLATILTAAMIAVLTLAVVPTSRADARPAPALTYSMSGSHLALRNGCSGAVRVDLYTDRAKPGRVTAKFTPGPFRRSCTAHVWVGWGLMGIDQIHVPVTSGPRRGPVVTRTYRTGSGPMVFSVGYTPSRTALNFYTLVP